jgi:putative acetyltransferase
LNYSIRSETKADYEGIREVNFLAFGHKENEAKLVEAIRNSPFFIPELSIVAVNDSLEVIGHILFSEITLETEKGPISTLGLAPMSVKTGYQHKGIGSNLVVKGIDACKNLGYKHVIVLGHPQFYPRFGFIPAESFGITSPFPVPSDVFMVLELESGSLNGLQGKVKYPPAFDTVT